MTTKTCRHCDIRFNRPDAAPIPHDRCERCHEEIEALAEAVKTGRKGWLTEKHKRLISEKLEFLNTAKATAHPPSSVPEDMEARSKYHREIKPGVWVDVYDVIQAFGVTNGALQHLVKKALAAGQRGHKTRGQDLADIVASAKRAQELEQ